MPSGRIAIRHDRLEGPDLGPFQRALVTRGPVMMGYAI
jgi:hypothetical protein